MDPEDRNEEPESGEGSAMNKIGLAVLLAIALASLIALMMLRSGPLSP